MKKGFLKIAYKYIVLFLVAAVLCVGSVYARYSTGSSGSVTTEIAAMGCSFTIDNVSTTTFTNASWVDGTGNTGYNFNTPQSIQYTVYNYEDHTTKTTSDVAAQAVYRMTLPYVFLSDVAVQMVAVDGTTSAETAVTPQFDLNAVISAISTAIDTNNSTTSTSYSTSTCSYDKISCTDLEATYTVSWQYETSNSLDNITKILLIDTTNNILITLRKTSTVSNLVLSYTRSRSDGGTDDKAHPYYASELLVEYAPNNDDNLTKLLTEWTIDISVPSLYLDNDAATSKTFKFYFTPITLQTYDASFVYGTSFSDSYVYCGNDKTANNGKITLTQGSSGTAVEYSVSIADISYTVNKVSVYSDSACSTWATAATVKVYWSGDTTTYSYYDSDSETYTDFTLSSGNIYSVAISNNTYYINTAEEVGEYIVTTYSTNDNGTLSGEVSTDQQIRVVRTGSGTAGDPYAYKYYYFDEDNEEYVACTQDTNNANVYSATVGTTPYYFNISNYSVEVDVTAYTDSSLSTGAAGVTIRIAVSGGTVQSYTLYLYDTSKWSYTTSEMLQYQSGTIYYTQDTFTDNKYNYYIQTSGLGTTGIITNNINNPLYSYDGVASYLIGGTADAASVNAIYYYTKAQVVFIQASTVTSSSSE